MAFIIGGCLFFCLGFIEDLKRLSPFVRLILQFIFSFILWIQGLKIEGLNLSIFDKTFFDYSISKSLVLKCASLLKLNIEFTNDFKKAMFVLGLKNHIRDNLFVLDMAKQENIPVYTIQNNSQTQITQILSTFAG